MEKNIFISDYIIFIILYIIKYILSIYIMIKWIKIGGYDDSIYDIIETSIIILALNILPFFPILIKILCILDFYNKSKKYKIKFNENMKKINDKYNE